jgi:hypothetical protein
MRASVAAWVVAVCAAGCAAEGRGLVIVFDGADVAAGGREIVALELFVGRTGPDARFVRDYDPERDLFSVTMAELRGYRLFLRADVVPTDLEAVAIVGYDGDPAAGGQPLVFGVVVDPPFVEDELHEIAMTFAPIVDRGTAGPTERWIERWGAAPIEPVLGHACLQWGLGLAAAAGQIVRADDLDCDGTVPPLCDEMQTDRLLLESDADVDGDGFGHWATAACAACLVQDEDDGSLIAVECDCDETDTAVHFGAAEACDGVDTDCDGVFDGNFTGPFSVPCQNPNPGLGDCDMGVQECTETSGVVRGACTSLPAQHVSCVDLSGCRTPRDCPIDGVPAPAALVAYHCVERVFGPQLDFCGTAPVTQFFPSLGVPAPARCSATLWGGNAAGWKVLLVDGMGQRDVAFTDVPCDELGFVVEEAPATSQTHTYFVLVLADAAGTPIAAVPIDLSTLTTDEPCADDETIACTPPVPST